MTATPTELLRLGWNDDFAAAFDALGDPRGRPARVTSEHQHVYRVASQDGDWAATVAGRLRHTAADRLDYPAVGDWVAIAPQSRGTRVSIHHVLPRRSRFVRKVAGHTTVAQVIAANIDIVFVVAGLDDDFNLRRIERYLVTTWEGGASPVVVLNKADLCHDMPDRLREVQSIAPDVPVVAVSCRAGLDVEVLTTFLSPGRTAALLGSSGVGKSTIINCLLGFERQRTRDVRTSDSRGRHTTTARELVVLPSGGLLIDTPGMRELQLWSVGHAIDDVFDDIRQEAESCHYRDCRHDTEPRCGVKLAVAEGRLDDARVSNYLRLQAELRHLETKQDQRALLELKRRERAVHRSLRQPRSRG